MFCPNCSQQQAAEDVRFCPRCGFALAGVRSLMAGGGVAPVYAPAALPPSPRQRGIRQGARLVFLSVILFPIFFGFCFVADSPGPLSVPATLFLAGLCWMIYARIFGESFVPPLGRDAGALTGRHMSADYGLPHAPRANAPALPPQHANTAEMVRPASVTDHTTHLLDSQKR